MLVNGFVEANPDVPLLILVSNFSKIPCRLPKGSFIAYAALSPLAYATLLVPGAQELCRIINTFQGTESVTIIIYEEAKDIEDAPLSTTVNIHRPPTSDTHPVKEIGPFALDQPSREPVPLKYDSKKYWRDAIELLHIT